MASSATTYVVNIFFLRFLRPRDQDETTRLYSVLEKRLEGREWLVGPHYGLADIKTL